MSSHISKIADKFKPLFLWILVAEMVAVLIRIFPDLSGLWEEIFQYVAVFVPAVRNADANGSFMGMDAIFHYATMWAISPILIIFLFLNKGEGWKGFFWSGHDSELAILRWVFLTICVIGIFVFPLWEAGPLKYMLFSLFIFAPLSAFLVYFCAVYVRFLIYRISGI